MKHNRLFLGLVAGTYTAFYARFSRQWVYLSNLYNQIKAAEVRAAGKRGDTNKRLAQWKAGFIEDAWTLHMIKKPLFDSVVRAWWTQEGVERAIRNWSHDDEALKRYLNDLPRVPPLSEESEAEAEIYLLEKKLAEANARLSQIEQERR